MKNDERLHFELFREIIKTAPKQNHVFIDLVERVHRETLEENEERYQIEKIPKYQLKECFNEMISTWEMAFPEKKPPFSTYESFLADRSRLRGKARAAQVLQEC